MNTPLPPKIEGRATAESVLWLTKMVYCALVIGVLSVLLAIHHLWDSRTVHRQNNLSIDERRRLFDITAQNRAQLADLRRRADRVEERLHSAVGRIDRVEAGVFEEGKQK
jgi:hypothetical protein